MHLGLGEVPQDASVYSALTDVPRSVTILLSNRLREPGPACTVVLLIECAMDGGGTFG